MRSRCAVAVLVPIVVLAGCGGTSTGTLRGTVVDDGRAPVAGTKLELTSVESGGERRTATTNARGGFAFADVKKGRYRVSVAYRVSGVFQCGVRYPVEVRAGKTVIRRLAVPVVDVGINGTATLPDGRTAACRTLKEPLRSFVCRSVVYPILLYALPPRTAGYGDGYRQLAFMQKPACRSLRVLGRLGGLPDAPRRPFGWMQVLLAGKQGWINPWVGRRLPAQLRAWQDVALAALSKVSVAAPAFGSGLPDLAFTTPVYAQHPGDPCAHVGAFAAEWAVSVRNGGQGLLPKHFSVHISNGSQQEVRRLGNAAWLRGLAPGETIPIEIGAETNHTYLGLNAYTHLKLDPDDKVKESDESNNDLSLGFLPQLTCVKVG
jgi:hypothetical protein